jgi:hypothetical protein
MAHISVFEFPEVEKVIRQAASGFHIEGHDFEDLVQIARISVWELVERRSITPENYKNNLGLIYNQVIQSLIREKKKASALKRSPVGGFQRLDDFLNQEEKGRRISDALISDPNFSDSQTENRRDYLLKFLKKIAKRSVKTRSVKDRKNVVRLLVAILEIELADIPKKINYHTFVNFGLQYWLWIFFNNSPFRAINYVYPEAFPLHALRAPQGYWKGRGGRHRALEALKRVLEKTGYSPEYYPKLLSDNFFAEFKLGSALAKIFQWDRFAYLDAAFPGKYRPWEFSFTCRGYFNDENNVKIATRWLVEDKLGYNLPGMTVGEIWDKQIALQLTKKIFESNGLRALIARYKSPEPLLRLTYPDKFLDWSFQTRGKYKGQPGLDLAAKATRWLIEEHLKISPNSPEITYNFLLAYGFRGMITSKKLGFNSSPRKLLENAYPDLF